MKAAEIEVKALFNLSHNMAGEFLAKFRYPYEALPELRAWITTVGLQLSLDEYEKRGEQIWIHESVKTAPSVNPIGPLTACANAELGYCTYSRRNVLVDAGSVAGSSYKFKDSLLFDSIKALYHNYADDLTLGYHAYMDAGSTTSNIESDRRSIVIRTDDGATEAGLRKVGVILGDYVEVGYGTVSNPGFVVGKNTVTYPFTSVRGPVPASLTMKSAGNIAIKRN